MIDLHEGILEEFTEASYKGRQEAPYIQLERLAADSVGKQREANRENMRFVRVFKPQMALHWRETERHMNRLKNMTAQKRAATNANGVPILTLCERLRTKSQAWVAKRVDPDHEFKDCTIPELLDYCKGILGFTP